MDKMTTLGRVLVQYDLSKSLGDYPFPGRVWSNDPSVNILW